MDVEFEQVKTCMEETEKDYELYASISDEVIGRYTKPLDDIMKGIYQEIVLVTDPPVLTLEKYHLELSNCLYFMGEKLEKLGAMDYLSKAKYKEVYNQAYLDAQVPNPEVNKEKKKTVAELQAISEESAKTEAVTNDIYSRAYKVLKSRIDAAGTMINTLSKSISRRMNEMSLPATPNSVGAINSSLSDDGFPVF